MFDGATGEELQTIDYKPGRDDDGLLWGDYAMARIEPGNRVDRFLSGVGVPRRAAPVGGVRPRLLHAHDDHRATTGTARRSSERWYVDSGHVPMTNPFNDGPHGRDGTNPEFATITTQGDHSLSVADVDGDGKQEIVYGSATIDDDGSLLYSSFDVLPAGSAAPGRDRAPRPRRRHARDRHRPDRARPRDLHRARGRDVRALRHRRCGTPRPARSLFGAYSGRDTGRAMIGDVRRDVPGIEVVVEPARRHRRAAAC